MALQSLSGPASSSSKTLRLTLGAAERARANGRALSCGVSVVGGGAFLLGLFPAAEVQVFARGTAMLAGLFAGVPVSPLEQGWLLVHATHPVAVTAACSATDFFLIVGAMLGWHAARQVRWIVVAAALALVMAVPVTLCVNALRVVAVAGFHRWIMPADDTAAGNYLHMAMGMAVFLPALIAMNLSLQIYDRRRRAA